MYCNNIQRYTLIVKMITRDQSTVLLVTVFIVQRVKVKLKQFIADYYHTIVVITGFIFSGSLNELGWDLFILYI